MWERDSWEGGPGAVVRQWGAFFFDGDLEVRLVGSHKSSHTGKNMRSVPHTQVAQILFAFNVFLLPMKPTLKRKKNCQ